MKKMNEMKVVLILCLVGIFRGNFSPSTLLFFTFPLMWLYNMCIISERLAKRESYVIQPHLNSPLIWRFYV